MQVSEHSNVGILKQELCQVMPVLLVPLWVAFMKLMTLSCASSLVMRSQSTLETEIPQAVPVESVAATHPLSTPGFTSVMLGSGTVHFQANHDNMMM